MCPWVAALWNCTTIPVKWIFDHITTICGYKPVADIEVGGRFRCQYGHLGVEGVASERGGVPELKLITTLAINSHLKRRGKCMTYFCPLSSMALMMREEDYCNEGGVAHVTSVLEMVSALSSVFSWDKTRIYFHDA